MHLRKVIMFTFKLRHLAAVIFIFILSFSAGFSLGEEEEKSKTDAAVYAAASATHTAWLYATQYGTTKVNRSSMDLLWVLLKQHEMTLTSSERYYLSEEITNLISENNHAN